MTEELTGAQYADQIIQSAMTAYYPDAPVIEALKKNLAVWYDKAQANARDAAIHHKNYEITYRELELTKGRLGHDGNPREANEAAHKLLAEMTTKNLALGQLREAEARVAVLERNVLSLQDERNKAQQSIKGLEAELTETRKKYTEALGQCCVPRSSHVQMVPDHCDRITYKGEYLSIPVILRQAKENEALKMNIQSLLTTIQSAQDACDDVKASHMKTNEIVKGFLEKLLGEKWETVPGNVTEAHKTLDSLQKQTLDDCDRIQYLKVIGEEKQRLLYNYVLEIQGLREAMEKLADDRDTVVTELQERLKGIEGANQRLDAQNKDLIGINKSLIEESQRDQRNAAKSQAEAVKLLDRIKVLEGPCAPGSPALLSVLEERQRQDKKWGTQDHDPFLYLTILGEEYGETCQAALEARFGEGTLDHLWVEAVQTAAVALAIVECLDRKKWAWPAKGGLK